MVKYKKRKFIGECIISSKIGQVSIKSENFDKFKQEMRNIKEFEDVTYNVAIENKPTSQKLKMQYRANIVAGGPLLESLTTEDINTYTAKHLGKNLLSVVKQITQIKFNIKRGRGME